MVKNILLATVLLLSLNSYAKVDTLDEHDNWNGCSGPLEGITLWKGWQRACNTHDWEYTRVGTDKYLADNRLKDNWQDACKANYWGPQETACRAAASLAYEGLRSSDSRPFWDAAQAKAKRLFLEDIDNQSGLITALSDSAPINGYANDRQRKYIHLVDERFVEGIIKLRNGWGMRYISNDEQWDMLKDAVQKYSHTYYGDFNSHAYHSWMGYWMWKLNYVSHESVNNPNNPSNGGGGCGGHANTEECR